MRSVELLQCTGFARAAASAPKSWRGKRHFVLSSHYLRKVIFLSFLAFLLLSFDGRPGELLSLAEYVAEGSPARAKMFGVLVIFLERCIRGNGTVERPNHTCTLSCLGVQGLPVSPLFYQK